MARRLMKLLYRITAGGQHLHASDFGTAERMLRAALHRAEYSGRATR
jgi:DNA-binding transcriptional regulator PaaX